MTDDVSGASTRRHHRSDLPPFAALRAFDAVGYSGGIRRAADLLSLDHTVVSRHLRMLEGWLGTVLYDRRGGAGLTEEGQRYYAKVSAALQDLTVATSEMMKVDETGALKISAISGLGLNWLVGRLPSFRSQFPEVDLEFRANDNFPDFLRDEADLDIRWMGDGDKQKLPSGVRTIELGRPPIFAVASPAYLSANPPIRTCADVRQARLLQEQTPDRWRQWFEAHSVEMDGVTFQRMWQPQASLEAARCGAGVALTNSYVVRDDLKTGRLVLVGPPPCSGFPAAVGGYVFSALETRWHRPGILRFRRWITREFEAEVEPALVAAE